MGKKLKLQELTQPQTPDRSGTACGCVLGWPCLCASKFLISGFHQFGQHELQRNCLGEGLQAWQEVEAGGLGLSSKQPEVAQKGKGVGECRPPGVRQGHFRLPGIPPDQLIWLPGAQDGQHPLCGWLRVEGGDSEQRPGPASPGEYQLGQRYRLTHTGQNTPHPRPTGHPCTPRGPARVAVFRSCTAVKKYLRLG